MISVTISLDDEVYKEWKQDPNSKGVIAKLVAEYYGYEILKSRVVKKTKASRYDSFKPLSELSSD